MSDRFMKKWGGQRQSGRFVFMLKFGLFYSLGFSLLTWSINSIQSSISDNIALLDAYAGLQSQLIHNYIPVSIPLGLGFAFILWRQNEKKYQQALNT